MFHTYAIALFSAVVLLSILMISILRDEEASVEHKLLAFLIMVGMIAFSVFPLTLYLILVL